MQVVQVLDEYAVFTPLGIRFWDPVSDRQIRSGLQVTAWPAEQPTLSAIAAVRSRSDIYIFQGLPGLRAVEYGLEEAAASPPPGRRFVVQTEDRENRFLASAIAIDLPLPYRGVFPGNRVGSPGGGSLPGFLLYSAPSRATPSWLAAIRGELHTAGSRQPAAHALVRVRLPDGREHAGLSDTAGRFALLFPYPVLSDGFGASPLLPGQGALSEQTWDVYLRIQYQPEAQLPLPGTVLPDYPSVLAQAPAAVWRRRPEDGGVAEAEWPGLLAFGSELSARTEGLTQLLVSPVGSSP